MEELTELTELEKKEKRGKYFKHVIEHKENVKIIIMGQDPYPTMATGVAFCKDEFWQFAGTCFFTILSSLGLDLDLTKYEGKNPINYFEDLAKNEGIVFLNLSNSLFSEMDPTKETIETIIESTFKDSNKKFLNELGKLDNIYFIKLGKNKKYCKPYKEIYASFLSQFKREKIVYHPSSNPIREVEDKEKNCLEWVSTWKMNGLKDLIEKDNVPKEI